MFVNLVIKLFWNFLSALSILHYLLQYEDKASKLTLRQRFFFIISEGEESGNLVPLVENI